MAKKSGKDALGYVCDDHGYPSRSPHRRECMHGPCIFAAQLQDIGPLELAGSGGGRNRPYETAWEHGDKGVQERVLP